MTAYQAIQQSLKELVSQKPFHKITVDDICRHCYISRSTFYKHFSSKFEVGREILKNDTIEAIQTLLQFLHSNSPEQDVWIHQCFFQCFYDERDFYKSLLQNQDQDWFTQWFIEECEAITQKYTEEFRQTMPPTLYEYTCYYIASSQAMLLKKWLLEDCPLSPEELASAFYEWTSSYWRRLLKE